MIVKNLSMKLTGKRVVITGGSKGLGRALAFRFVAEGAHVAICARSLDPLNRVWLELQPYGTHNIAYQCDIGDADQVSQFAEKVLEEFQSVDVLINNASLLGPRIEIADFTKSSWERIIDVNVNGLFYVTKAFLPSMIQQRSGSIINVTSSVGKAGRARWGAYAVSKFAMEGFTQTLADELKTYGVRVNSVNPGGMATEMRRAAYPHEDQRKLKTPEQITDVFVYLASDESRAISGQYFEAQQFVTTTKEPA